MDQRVNNCLEDLNEQQYNNFVILESYKTDDCSSNTFQVSCHLAYVSMVKTPLRLLVANWATASSKVNTYHVRSKSLLSTALLLPLRVFSVLEQVSIYKPNFIVKDSSHNMFECSL